jgi:hypothetical protein
MENAPGFSNSEFMTFSARLRNQRPVDFELREADGSIARMSLRCLRAAIQDNKVSFPAQVPVFECQARSDIQWRLVELYFVRNWTCLELGRRYGVTVEWARKLISNWVQRAIVLGYLQEIPALDPLLVDANAPAEAIQAADHILVSPAPFPEPLVFTTARSSRL